MCVCAYVCVGVHAQTSAEVPVVSASAVVKGVAWRRLGAAPCSHLLVCNYTHALVHLTARICVPQYMHVRGTHTFFHTVCFCLS